MSNRRMLNVAKKQKEVTNIEKIVRKPRPTHTLLTPISNACCSRQVQYKNIRKANCQIRTEEEKSPKTTTATKKIKRLTKCQVYMQSNRKRN